MSTDYLQRVERLSDLLREFPIIEQLAKNAAVEMGLGIAPVEACVLEKILAAPTLIDREKIEGGYPFLTVLKVYLHAIPEAPAIFCNVFATCSIFDENLDEEYTAEQEQKIKALLRLILDLLPKQELVAEPNPDVDVTETLATEGKTRKFPILTYKVRALDDYVAGIITTAELIQQM